jgi:hypothetical protein
MIKKLFSPIALLIILFAVTSCNNKPKQDASNGNDSTAVNPMKEKVSQFALIKLSADLSLLSEKERQMIPILLEVAQIMDDLYWKQTLGDKKAFLDTITDPDAKQFAMINYGPWERLNDNKPFISGIGEKPKGVNFYPADMTKEEFEAYTDKNKTNLYTIIQRGEDGKLKTVWYHEAYKAELEKAAALINKAAALAEDAGLKKYLELRANALLNSDYLASDMAWMDMKTNGIDFVVGPIENYEDALYGYKAAFESFVLIKDKEWSKKLDKYISFLPVLQKELPVDIKYKKEVPGTSSDLGVYDAVYYGGDCNSGSKTIAINLPNDERVHLKKGSRRLQLKNSMKAKFDNILMPIAQKLIEPNQLANVKFDAFFNNVMFHEVAHGLGIKNTINKKGAVRTALKDVYSSWEEAKADILGLYMVNKLIEKGEIKELTAEDCYVTFMAGIFRSVRFGAASSHGKANMMCFNFFESNGAFSRNTDGSYKVDFAKMKLAVNAWAEKILVYQGNGDYEGALVYLKDNATINEQLQKELDALKTANIPVDIVFEQGKEALGL